MKLKQTKIYKKFGTILLIAIVFLVGFGNPQISQAAGLSDIRSITYWSSIGTDTISNHTQDKFLGCSANYINELEAQIPQIKAAGFNTVWLIPYMQCFMTQTYPAVYDESHFDRLRQVLDMLHKYGMKAELPLDYIYVNLPGTSVPGEDVLVYKDAQGNPIGYWAIRDYYTKFLTEIEAYSNDVIILLFTEGLIGAASLPYSNPDMVAQVLRDTVGRLPLDLPSTLRNKFTIGFHDVEFRWTEPNALTSVSSPLPLPNPYDFYSVPAYIDNIPSWGIYSSTLIDQWETRLKNYFGSGLTIFHGELGAVGCNLTSADQITYETDLVSHALNRQHGFNVWEWIGYRVVPNPPTYPGCKDPNGVDVVDLGLIDNTGVSLPMRSAVQSLLWQHDTTVPTVTITAPANGAIVSGSSVPISANASDNIAVTSVQFKLDGSNLGSADITLPFGTTLNSTQSSNTTHTLSATVKDAAGNQTTTSISITINNSGPTPLPGDLNLDHIVNSLDWSLMNAKWFTSDPTADLNHDGIVNAIDFSILNNNWFKTW